jgi:hypothetical protein
MASPHTDRAQMAAVLNRYDETLGSSLVFTIGGLAVLAGSVALAIGLRRARAVPAWVSVGLVAGMFLNIAGFSAGSTGVLILSSVVLLVALGWVGWRLLATPTTAANESLVPVPVGAR